MLYVKPIEGYLTRQTNMLLSMDPYCVLIFGGKQFKTSPHFSGGSRPKWSETFSFDVNTLDKIKVEAWSRAVISNDSIIGKGQLDLRKLRLIPGTAMQEYVELFFEGKPAGKILLELAFTAQVVKKKHIFDEKVRGSLASQPSDLKDLRSAEKDKQRHKQRMAKEQKNDNNGLFFSFGKFAQEPSQQALQPQQTAHHKSNQNQNQAQMNLQQKIPSHQPSSQQQIPQQQGFPKQQQNFQKPQSGQIPPEQQQTKPNNPPQQNGFIKQANFMPGLPHNRGGLQRPTSPMVNAGKLAPMLQKYNNGGANQFNQIPSALSQDQKVKNPEQPHNKGFYQIQRENKQMSASDKIEKVGIGKTPPKSILSPAKKKRSKSNKKVTFQC